jgi:hypothetical protein
MDMVMDAVKDVGEEANTTDVRDFAFLYARNV